MTNIRTFGCGCHSLREVCADLTDVTLADEDTNSILADNAKRAIQGNEAMQVGGNSSDWYRDQWGVSN